MKPKRAFNCIKKIFLIVIYASNMFASIVSFLEVNNIFLCLLIAVVVAIRWQLKKHYSVFEMLGIPGPKPSLLCGNLKEILEKGQLEAVKEWRKDFGRVFGYFEGYTPVLSVADPEIVREVLVKDFQNFSHRKPFPLAPRKSLGLFLENGSQWKRSRTILTPAFSTGKLKQMYGTMADGVDKLMTNLDRNETQTSVDIYGLFQCLTLDVIGRCAFGLQTNAQSDTNDPFLVNIRSLFGTLSKTLILPLVMLIPFVQHFIFALKNVVMLFGMNPVVWIRLQMKEVIGIRKSIGTTGQDFDLVHQMMFADCKEDNKMTEREIVAQSMTFLLAGYETTSAVLAFYTHLLAAYPHVQSRLFEEIEQTISDGPVTYDCLSDMSYFNMVFNEVCRLYPTASQLVTRKAALTRIYNEITIPAGMNVLVDVWGLHRDPDLWEDPDTFDPERFSVKNKNNIKPFSFLPFGAGPRSCIGARFAMLESKTAILRMLQKYILEIPKNEKEDVELICRGAIVPKNGVHVSLKRRGSCPF